MGNKCPYNNENAADTMRKFIDNASLDDFANFYRKIYGFTSDEELFDYLLFSYAELLKEGKVTPEGICEAYHLNIENINNR